MKVYGEVEVYEEFPSGERKLFYKKENKILHTGKKLLLDMMFRSVVYKLKTIHVGDGAVQWGSGGSFSSVFYPDDEYPSVNETVPNKVGESNIALLSSIGGSSEGGWAITLVANIASHLHVTGTFDSNNVDNKINSISVVAEGVDTPAIGSFSVGDPIPFSNLTIPNFPFNPADQKVLYINWRYRIV